MYLLHEHVVDMQTCCGCTYVDVDGCEKENIFNLLQHVVGMRRMGCVDVLWMGVDTDVCKETRKKKNLTVGF